MRRRTFLASLSATVAVLALRLRGFLGSGEAVAQDAGCAVTDELSSCSPSRWGLPKDWRFTAPSAVPARLPLRTGRRESRDFPLGNLNPAGSPFEGGLDGLLQREASDALDVATLNGQFNPFVDTPRAAAGQAIVGPFRDASELYQGKAFIPARYLMFQALEGAPVEAAPKEALLTALPELILIRTPAHQFALKDGPGNHVIFYGLREVTGQGPQHTEIDRITHALSGRGCRLIKQMVHFDKSAVDEGAQGGAPDAIVRDGVGGATHAGGFSAGRNAHGHAVSVKSDWPAEYGWLNDYSESYNAHLFAIDYRGGVREPIPDREVQAYCRNADMWDCCAAILVPFVEEDQNPDYQDYTFNPLEVYDQASARRVAASLAQLDRVNFLADHGAFYCAEGQYVVANLGPQEDEQGGTLLKRSRFGDSPFGKLIDEFQSAPAYAGMAAEERRMNPSSGWAHLLSLGPTKGGIDADQFRALSASDRTAVCLEWLPEDIRGWQSYGPLDDEALIAGPMTVAGMAWALLRNYMPRQPIARAIAAEIADVHDNGPQAARDAIVQMLAGNNIRTPEGELALSKLAFRAATGLLLGLLTSEEVRDKMLQKAGFEEITNEQDKAKVMKAYAGFLDLLLQQDLSDQAAMDAALLRADAKMRDLRVTRKYHNRATRRTDDSKTTLMLYAAPACFGFWAQQPFFAGTNCIRYVATAMHVNQSKSS